MPASGFCFKADKLFWPFAKNNRITVSAKFCQECSSHAPTFSSSMTIIFDGLLRQCSKDNKLIPASDL